MIFPLSHLASLMGPIFLGTFGGYIYGLLFVQRQTGVFLLQYTRLKIFFFDALRLLVLMCIIGNVLLNDFWRSILIIMCFLIVFWIQLFFLKK